MSQGLFASTECDSITKPTRRRNIRLSLDHEGNGLWFQYSTAGRFIVRAGDGRGHEAGEIWHRTNLAANGLSSQLPVTDFFLFVIVGSGCATLKLGCPDPLQA